MIHSQSLKKSEKMAKPGYIIFGAAIALYLSTALISPAHAGALSTTLCVILRSIVQSNIGRGAATLAVMSVGIAGAMGKVSMGMAITVAVGISILYEATDIALTILPNTTGAICPISR